jgi:hypothetical protein
LRVEGLLSGVDFAGGFVGIQCSYNDATVDKDDEVCAPGLESNFSENLSKWRFRTQAPELRRATQVKG